MLPEVSRILDPLAAAVTRAQDDLRDVNSDDTAHPYDSLRYAGRVIRALEELNERMWDLLDAAGEPVTEHTRMQIQGRLRALESEGTHDN